jgi:WD40-like Beta Propeller Repeat
MTDVPTNPAGEPVSRAPQPRARHQKGSSGRSSRPLLIAVLVVGVLLVALVGALVGLQLSKHSTGSGTQPTTTPTTGTRLATTTTVSSTPVSRPNQIVAVNSGGAVQVIDAASGAVIRTLVPTGAVGPQVTVTPDGKTVYFEKSDGCEGEIDAVPMAGGAVTSITKGSLPTVSPDGKTLALAREPSLSDQSCPGSGNIALQFSVVLRQLVGGSEKSFPMSPALASSGLPAPVSYLSWSADNRRLAVSVSSVEDNEGWNLYLFDTSSDSYYVAPNSPTVPVTGDNAAKSYYGEGAFLPDGKLFAVRLCCTGIPPTTSSVILQLVSASSGAVSDTVAVGYSDRAHTSLGSDSSGQWLLYLSGTELEISHNGGQPSPLPGSYLAVTW